jgi:hypothetical protein
MTLGFGRPHRETLARAGEPTKMVGAVDDSSLRIPTAEQCKIRPLHLKELPKVQSLLSALNDAYVSSYQIAELVQRIPVLAARCVRRAVAQKPLAPKPTTFEQVLTMIGNQGLESELLTLLEDLTITKAELDDK